MRFPDRTLWSSPHTPTWLARVDCAAAKLLTILASAVAVLAIAGCFGKGDGPTGTVMGRVTFNGQPAAEGRVAFISSKGHGASGLIGANGEFTLRRVEGAGILVGDYQVVVQPPPPEPPSPSSVPEEANQKNPRKMMIGAPGDPVVKEYPDIPMMYRNPTTSGWNVTVKEGANRFDFEMKR